MKRITNITHDSAWKASFSYDANGNLVRQVCPAATNTGTYNNMNRLTNWTLSVSNVNLAASFAYDANGVRTNIVYPGGLSVSYTLDAENRLQKVTTRHPGRTNDFNFIYDNANRLTQLRYPHGITNTMGYDRNGLVTNIIHGNFIKRTIQRDALGFKIAEAIHTGFCPVSATNNLRINTHNDADQLTAETIMSGSSTSTVTASYSPAGSLTQQVENARTTQYSYDYANRISGCSGTTNISYRYDASGARAARTQGAGTRYYLPDPADPLKRPLAEISSSGSIVRYFVWAGNRLLCEISSGGMPYYYHSDEQGSTLAITTTYPDGSLAIIDQFAYTPYGQTKLAADLHLTLHRAYSAKDKRFLQSDPIGLEGGPNLYWYGDGNPLVYIDPFGLFKEPVNPSKFYWEDGSKPARHAQADNLLTTMGAPAPYGFDNSFKAEVAASTPAIIGVAAIGTATIAAAPAALSPVNAVENKINYIASTQIGAPISSITGQTSLGGAATWVVDDYFGPTPGKIQITIESVERVINYINGRD